MAGVRRPVHPIRGPVVRCGTAGPLDRVFDLGVPTAPHTRPAGRVPRKEVIQPHLPVRLPCYDFTPVTRLTLGVGLVRLQVPRAPMV